MVLVTSSAKPPRETPSDTTSPRPSIPFPVSFNPATEVITIEPNLAPFLQKELALESETTATDPLSWFGKVTRRFALLPWYQSGATPSSRTLVIWAGDRHEEVTDNFVAVMG